MRGENRCRPRKSPRSARPRHQECGLRRWLQRATSECCRWPAGPSWYRRAVSTRELKPLASAGLRSITRRLNSVSLSLGQRMLSLSSCWLSLASAVTLRPPAPQYHARVGVGAQKGRRRRVVNAQAFEQGVGGVTGARAFGAEQIEAEIGECVGLGLRGQRLHDLHHLPDRQSRRHRAPAALRRTP